MAKQKKIITISGGKHVPPKNATQEGKSPIKKALPTQRTTTPAPLSTEIRASTAKRLRHKEVVRVNKPGAKKPVIAADEGPVIMRTERYRTLATRLEVIRTYARDTLRANMKGEDIGLPLDHCYKHPMPERIIKGIEPMLVEVIKQANAALFVLANHWSADHPKDEIPKEVTCEYKP